MKLLISYIRAQVKGVAMGKVYRTHETWEMGKQF